MCVVGVRRKERNKERKKEREREREREGGRKIRKKRERELRNMYNKQKWNKEEKKVCMCVVGVRRKK